MNTRIFSVIAVVTLVIVSTGCSGARNCLFGRGARCGLCNRFSNPVPAPQFGNTMQAPCAPTCQTPTCQGDYNPYAGNPYEGQIYSSGSQPSDCGCARQDNFIGGYGPMTSDPYMQGEIVQDQVIGSQGYPNSTVPIQGDNFNARRFDSDGNRILWEQPLPSGNTSL